MEFLVLALLAGLGVVMIAAPLGTFIVWQRLAYFGDTLAHSALLGVAFSLILAINIQAGIIVCCLLVATVLVWCQSQHQLPSDTLLGIISHSSLALGLILASLFDTGRLDLTLYLLGDILSVSRGEVLLIYLSSAVISLLIWRYWTPLLAITVNEAIAQVEGVAVKPLQFLLFTMLAITIALGIKIVGVLLIGALLIIPAAGARYLAVTPEQMVVWAAVIGGASVVVGLAFSFYWDTPTGPSIVASSSLGFLLALCYKRSRNR